MSGEKKMLARTLSAGGTADSYPCGQTQSIKECLRLEAK